MAAKVDKICEACGKEFTVAKWREKYSKRFFCSKECNYSSRRGKSVAKICTACGKEFAVPKWRERHQKRFFCSKECRYGYLSGENHWNWKGFTQVCVICRKEFASYPSRITARRQCCSSKCRGKLISQKQSGDQHWNWQGGQIEKTCEVCSQSFLTWPHVIENGHGRFCSPECKVQWLGEKQNGDGHWNWQGGKSFEPYPIEFNNLFKKAIRERDNHTCAICRFPGKDVHHIDYDKQNTIEENCITLCHFCHIVTNGNREYWAATLSELIQRRMITCQV